SIMRELAYLVLLAICIRIIICHVPSLENGLENDEKPTESGSSPLAAELCQFLELKETGSEGVVDKKKYKLKGMTVVFRHGERSGCVRDDLSKHQDCAPFRDKDRKRFEVYTKVIDSPEFARFLKVDKEFKQYPLSPLKSECSPGNLTAEGALQLSKLGKQLRRAYKETELYNERNRLDVKVVVSPFRRTFQSSVALLSSFLFPMKKHVDEVRVEYSNETFHCADKFCV
ncbi:hypothetical protein PFISCL1PPCAC_11589, partial [Pristionchus fissidentatus]